MKLIIGLGNPGEQYSQTRHNLGFMVVDELVRQGGLEWEKKKHLQAEIAKKHEIMLAKPLTLMNDSGLAVKRLVNFHKFNNFHNLYIIHDDVDLALGQIKLARNRGAAGHHGVESIIKHLDTQDFYRLRLGIGRPVNPGTAEDYVLSQFMPAEKPIVQKMIQEAIKILVGVAGSAPATSASRTQRSN